MVSLQPSVKSSLLAISLGLTSNNEFPKTRRMFLSPLGKNSKIREIKCFLLSSNFFGFPMEHT